MKKKFKSIITILVTILSVSCNNSQLCKNSSDKAFEAFQLNVKTKDFFKAKTLLSSNKNGVFENYIDTIFNVLDKPTLEFIPVEKDGAFGIKKNGGVDTFFTYLKEDNKIFSTIGIMFRKNINCYEIINIVTVGISKEININNDEYFDKTTNSKYKVKKNDLPIKPNILETAPLIEEQHIYNNVYDLWYNGRSQEAIKQFRSFIEQHPKSSLADDAQRMIGTSYGNLGNYEQAVKEYKKVKINYPNANSTPLSLYEMAHLYFYSLNDFKEAKYYYNEFINSATEENVKWRDIAVEQLKNWDEQTQRYKGYAVVEKVTKSPKIYDINVEQGKYVAIRKGPGEQYEKIINIKATEALGYTDYINVGYSAKVIIQETNDGWSKIKVVDPEWLSATHIGWIPTKNILKSNSEDEKDFKNLASEAYEIIKIEHNRTVQNFHILIKQKEFDKESVFIFVKRFRNEHCTMDCNVLVYDSKSILPLIDKYPLEGNDYINLADHFIYMSSFDAVNVKDWYPFQDSLYKDYGGKNWKNEVKTRP